MNKAEVIREVSALSGIEPETCVRVLDAMENVFSNELSHTKGKSGAFEKIYNLLGYLRNKKENK